MKGFISGISRCFWLRPYCSWIFYWTFCAMENVHLTKLTKIIWNSIITLLFYGGLYYYIPLLCTIFFFWWWQLPLCTFGISICACTMLLLALFCVRWLMLQMFSSCLKNNITLIQVITVIGSLLIGSLLIGSLLIGSLLIGDDKSNY